MNVLIDYLQVGLGLLGIIAYVCLLLCLAETLRVIGWRPIRRGITCSLSAVAIVLCLSLNIWLGLGVALAIFAAAVICRAQHDRRIKRDAQVRTDGPLATISKGPLRTQVVVSRHFSPDFMAAALAASKRRGKHPAHTKPSNPIDNSEGEK